MAILSEIIKSFVSQQKIDTQTNQNQNEISSLHLKISKPPKILKTPKKPKSLPVVAPVIAEVESNTAEYAQNRPVAQRAAAVALNKPQAKITTQGRSRS